VPRNLQITRSLAPLHLYDTSLDDVVHVAVADCAVLALPVINCAEDDFEDPVDWDAIEENIENIMAGLKSRNPAEREAAIAEAISLGVDPRLVLNAQLLNNSSFRRHSEKLPDLEKRARLLSAEYREVQKSRPIDVIPVAGN
jgi:hypothetical protein